jgi:hypothetical protein
MRLTPHIAEAGVRLSRDRDVLAAAEAARPSVELPRFVDGRGFWMVGRDDRNESFMSSDEVNGSFTASARPGATRDLIPG